MADTPPLERAIELALGELRSGPPLGAFGIAREDCALAHMDYFLSIQIAAHTLAEALAQARGTDAASIHREYGAPETPCDCGACLRSKEKAQAARERHVASYTNVKEWVESPGV